MAEGIGIHARHPRVAVHGPAFLLDDLLHLAGPLLVQTVHVQLAVQVVGLVLHAACEPAGRLEMDGVAVLVKAVHRDPLGALEGEAVTGEGQAALFLLVGVRVSGRNLAQGQHRVDDAAARGNAVLVLHLVGEDAQAHTDLRCRQTHAVGCVHGFVHVSHELLELIIKLGDGCRGAVQNGVAVNNDGANSHRIILCLC